MDFKTSARLGACLAKEYARDFFEQLVTYQNISASEAASRLGLHIRTAQDFLDELTELDILNKEEVFEKKRPYFRYSLKTQRIALEIDLEQMKKQLPPGDLTLHIRERANNGANFSLARHGNAVSQISFWSGDSRDRKERKINLSQAQGKFMYYLPFPKAEPLSIADIMHKAGVEADLSAEVLDLVSLLEKNNVIEVIVRG